MPPWGSTHRAAAIIVMALYQESGANDKSATESRGRQNSIQTRPLG